jgi:hypothetical protein
LFLTIDISLQLYAHIRADWSSEPKILTFVCFMKDIQTSSDDGEDWISLGNCRKFMLAWWFVSFLDIHLYVCNVILPNLSHGVMMDSKEIICPWSSVYAYVTFIHLYANQSLHQTYHIILLFPVFPDANPFLFVHIISSFN